MPSAGRIDVFRNLSGTWTLEQSLESSLPAQSASLGLHISLDHGNLFSTSEAGTSGSPHTRGAGHLFRINPSGTWLGGTAIYPPVRDYVGFGRSSEVSGNTAIVGTYSPQVRIFDLDGGFRLTGVEADSQLSSENTNQLKATGGQPNQMTWLAFSLSGFGATNIAQLGVLVDLNNPSPMGSAQRTDVNGNATWSFYIPAAAEEASAWWQAVQSGGKSNAFGAYVR